MTAVIATIILAVLASGVPATAPDSLLPLTEGKTLKIRGLETVPLEVTAPPKFKFFMDSGGEDYGPRGHLEGPGGLDIQLEQPDQFFSLAKQREYLHDANPVTVVLRGEETSDGYLVLYEARRPQSEKQYGSAQYGAIVSRPKLRVTCSIDWLERRSDAELAARLCLSLRATPRPVVDLSRLAPLSPLEKGNEVQMAAFEPIPLAITMPPNFKFDTGPASKRRRPRGIFDGPKGVRLWVERPVEAKWATMAERRALLVEKNASVDFVRAEQTADGYLLIYLQTISSAGESYEVFVSRPALNVTCEVGGIQKLADAERLAAACLSLRAGAGPDRR